MLLKCHRQHLQAQRVCHNPISKYNIYQTKLIQWTKTKEAQNHLLVIKSLIHPSSPFLRNNLRLHIAEQLSELPPKSMRSQSNLRRPPTVALHPLTLPNRGWHMTQSHVTTENSAMRVFIDAFLNRAGILLILRNVARCHSVGGQSVPNG